MSIRAAIISLIKAEAGPAPPRWRILRRLAWRRRVMALSWKWARWAEANGLAWWSE